MKTSDEALNIHELKEPVQKRSIETRNRIVEAARSLFTELGFEETTTHLIAERAGLSVGGIYAHFKNKEIIFLYILELRSKEVYQVTLESVAKIRSENMPLEEVLGCLFRTWHQAHIKHGKLNREMQKFCIMNEAAARIHDHWEKAEADEVLSLLKEYQDELKVDDIDSAMIVIARATHEVFHYLYRERERIDEMIILDSLITMLKKFLMN